MTPEMDKLAFYTKNLLVKSLAILMHLMFRKMMMHHVILAMFLYS